MSRNKRYDIQRTYKDWQSKFVYYLLGINVAAIGFTVSISFEMHFSGPYILCFLALLSWLTSIIFSFKWAFVQFHSYKTEINLQSVLNKNLKSNKSLKKQTLNKITVERYNAEKRSYNSIKIMVLMTILGVAFFISWSFFTILGY